MTSSSDNTLQPDASADAESSGVLDSSSHAAKDETAVNDIGAGNTQPDVLKDNETPSEPDAVNDEVVNSEVKINGELLEKLPDDLYIPPDALEVFLETFQGPLDLLLYLIRKQNLDILNIPVALITRQYMEYVELMRHFRLDLAAEYLVMAATLAEIKSRMLLPRPSADEEGDEEDPRALLIKRLQEYERFTQAAREIDERPRLERELFLVTAEFEDHAPVKIESRASLNDLVVAFRNVIDRSEKYQHFAVGHERLTVREKMTAILDRVRTHKMLRFEDFFDPDEGRLGLVVCFMAILELTKENMLIVVQNEPFAPIHLKSVGDE